MATNLERRIDLLERTVGNPNVPDSVAVDVPGSQDLALIGGQWRTVPDGRRLLAEHKDAPIKLYVGWDPREI